MATINSVSKIYKVLFSQKQYLIACSVIVACTFSSCKKSSIYEGTPYALKVFNGVNGAVNLYGNYNGDRPTSFKNALAIQSRRISIYSYFNDDEVNGSYFSIPDTMAKDQPVLKQDFNLKSSSVNTLYLIGDKNNVDHLLVPQTIQKYTTGDSVAYISIVNISNGQPVSVNIAGRSNGSFLSSVSYKAVSDIVELPVKKSDVSYSIQFKDASNGELLAEFFVDNSNPIFGDFNTYLYKNISLVLVGKRGESGADRVEVVRVNHD